MLFFVCVLRSRSISERLRNRWPAVSDSGNRSLNRGQKSRRETRIRRTGFRSCARAFRFSISFSIYIYIFLSLTLYRSLASLYFSALSPARQHTQLSPPCHPFRRSCSPLSPRGTINPELKSRSLARPRPSTAFASTMRLCMCSAGVRRGSAACTGFLHPLFTGLTTHIFTRSHRASFAIQSRYLVRLSPSFPIYTASRVGFLESGKKGAKHLSDTFSAFFFLAYVYLSFSSLLSLIRARADVTSK